MTGGLTLSVYFGLRYLKAVTITLLLCVGLIFAADTVELLRRASEKPDATTDVVMTIALFRLPSLAEQTVPFAILFGAMAALLALSRKLELVVARASGVSAWQFLLPAFVVTFLIGVLLVTAYNPMAAALRERSDTLLAETIGGAQTAASTRGVWLRQDGEDGPSILRAGAFYGQGETVTDATFFLYAPDQTFRGRIDAERATLEPGRWVVENATIYGADGTRRSEARVEVATRLNLVNAREEFAAPDAVPFWALPGLIRAAADAGLPAHRYRLRFQTLLARPLLLCAMVLIAATVSLRVFRMGGVVRLIVGGVIAGLVLYVATELAEDLGGAGFVGPIFAAWATPLMGLAFGATVLLHLEDG